MSCADKSYWKVKFSLQCHTGSSSALCWEVILGGLVSCAGRSCWNMKCLVLGAFTWRCSVLCW